MNKVKVAGLVAIALMALPLFAHHGTAVSYDQKRVVKVTGTVKDFLWRNPHSQLYVDGKDELGNAGTFSLEMGSPNTMAPRGYTRKTFKAGDEVALGMHPSFTNPTSGEAVLLGVVINGKPMPESGNQEDK